MGPRRHFRKKNTHWNDILYDKCRKIVKLDTNQQNHFWNFYRYPPGFIRCNHVIRLQSAEGGRCFDQFARSSEISEARRVVKPTHNRTKTCLYPIRNTILYMFISKIHPNGNFPPTNSVNITSYTLYSPQGRRFLSRWANELPGVKGVFVYSHHGPLLPAWFNFNLSMDKLSHVQWSVRWNYLSIPKFQRLTAEVWEIISSFSQPFIMDTITYPCRDKNYSMLMKGVPGLHWTNLWLDMYLTLSCHSCCRCGDTRGKGNIHHGVDLDSYREYSRPSIWLVKHCGMVWFR